MRPHTCSRWLVEIKLKLIFNILACFIQFSTRERVACLSERHENNQGRAKQSAWTNSAIFALTVTEVRIGVLAVAASVAFVFCVVLYDAVWLPAGHLDDFPIVVRIPLRIVRWNVVESPVRVWSQALSDRTTSLLITSRLSIKHLSYSSIHQFNNIVQIVIYLLNSCFYRLHLVKLSNAALSHDVRLSRYDAP